jgi:hypothetical protein
VRISNEAILAVYSFDIGIQVSRVFSRIGAYDSFSETSRSVLGPTLSFIFNGHWGYFPGIKRPGRDVKHSPPFSAKVKNEWSYYTFTPIHLHGTNKGNFNLLFSSSVIYALKKKNNIRTRYFSLLLHGKSSP